MPCSRSCSQRAMLFVVFRSGPGFRARSPVIPRVSPRHGHPARRTIAPPPRPLNELGRRLAPRARLRRSSNKVGESIAGRHGESLPSSSSASAVVEIASHHEGPSGLAATVRRDPWRAGVLVARISIPPPRPSVPRAAVLHGRDGTSSPTPGSPGSGHDMTVLLGSRIIADSFTGGGRVPAAFVAYFSTLPAAEAWSGTQYALLHLVDGGGGGR